MKIPSLILAVVFIAPLAAQPPKMRELPKDLKPFQYVDAKIPFYPAGAKWGTIGKTTIPMQLPLAPAESLRHMVTPVDFDVQLVAADPQIRRPICMNWDERGRLWIAESVDYPNERKPDGKGNDRLVICEDKDGDGTMDAFTVFADKLSIPTSFAFANGGVVVHQAPHTLFLKDTDGDDKADERKILFTGWSTNDTHAGPSNLHYGLDNWFYGVVGYAGFKGDIGGERHDFRTGIYRVKPDGGKFEFLRNTNNNTWGLGLSEDGLVFASTANGTPSVYLPIPNRYYESVRGLSSSVLSSMAESNKFYPITNKVRQVDYHGGFTAAAGHALYTARLYPKYYWNRTAFVTEPTGHLVATFEIQRVGARGGLTSDFTSRNAWNLLASDDEWTSPIMAEVGPDGCVWIIDWYNYIVQHNPTPAGFKTGKGNAYETPLRDKKHGRIVKLVPKGAKLPANLNLKDAAPGELVAALTNDNLFWRRHAQRLLVERGKKDVVPALIKLVQDPSLDALNLNVGALHALWTLKGLGAVDEDHADGLAAAQGAARHKSDAVRRNAVAVLPPELFFRHAIERRLDVFQDPDAHVRQAALLAWSEVPLDRLTKSQRGDVAQALAAALNQDGNLKDRWLPDALTIAIAHDAETFLGALGKSKTIYPMRAREVVARVSEHYARGLKDGAGVEAVLATWTDANADNAEALVRGLVKGWRKGVKLKESAAAEKFLVRYWPLFAKEKADLLRLAEVTGVAGLESLTVEITRSLWASLEKDAGGDAVRVDAARQLVALFPRDEKVAGRLLAQLTPRTSPEFATGLLDALSASAVPELAGMLLKRMPELSPVMKGAGLRMLLGKAETTRALLDAFEGGKMQIAELSLAQKQTLLAHPEKGIASRAKKLLASGGGLPSADRQKVIDQFLPLLAKKANADAGKLMFKKHCAVCHTHNGEGNKVGPDLTGMAVHPKAELLIHLLDPSRSVEGNYRLYSVSTADGRFFNGMLTSESKTAIELIDPQAKKHVVQREEIDTLQATSKSVMPEGFEKQLSEQEVLDLLEFLTQRGKYFTLPLDRVANVVSTVGMFISKEAPEQRLILPDWSPRTVKGVPFYLIDPREGRIPNVLMLQGPQGYLPPKMPKSVKLPCNAPAKAIHFLSGISGWGYPATPKGTTTLTVRLHYDDGKTEDHPLVNGIHFSDYIRRIDVPGSEFAFAMRGQQMRYLAVIPKRSEVIREIELVKGTGDGSAPVVMAVTVESREKE